jgi:acyl carrier protein
MFDPEGPVEKSMTAATREEIASHVRSFLQQTAPAVADEIAKLPADAQLWEVVDSLSLLDLVEYMEQTFSFKLDPLELIPDNFETIELIVGLVHDHVAK